MSSFTNAEVVIPKALLIIGNSSHYRTSKQESYLLWLPFPLLPLCKAPPTTILRIMKHEVTSCLRRPSPAIRESAEPQLIPLSASVRSSTDWLMTFLFLVLRPWISSQTNIVHDMGGDKEKNVPHKISSNHFLHFPHPFCVAWKTMEAPWCEVHYFAHRKAVLVSPHFSATFSCSLFHSWATLPWPTSLKTAGNINIGGIKSTLNFSRLKRPGVHN